MGAPIIFFAVLALLIVGALLVVGVAACGFLVRWCERRKNRIPYIGAALAGLLWFALAEGAGVNANLRLVTGMPLAIAVGGWVAAGILSLSHRIAAALTRPVPQQGEVTDTPCADTVQADPDRESGGPGPDGQG